MSTIKQQLKVKSSIVDANNRLNGVFNSFDSFNNEFSSGNKLIDIYSSHFTFHHSNRKNSNTRKIHLCHLHKIVFHTSINPKKAIIISDTSIKNQVATFITYVHTYEFSVIKTIHYTINVISTEVELFAISYGLNQAIWLTNIEHIIIITDFIQAAKNIFNSSIHLYQIQLVGISKEITSIPLISGTALVKTIGHFIVLLTKRQKVSIYHQFSHANYHGITVKKMNVMTSLASGR